MKRFISTQHQLEAPVDKVFDVIAKGDEVETWIPMIKESFLTSKNTRECKTQDNLDLKETFIAAEVTKTFMMTVTETNAFPAENMVVTIKLDTLNDNVTTMSWDLEMDLEDDNIFDEMEKNIKELYVISAQKLEVLALA